jgi:hypothetical protein
MHGSRADAGTKFPQPCCLIRVAAWVFPDYSVAGAAEAFVDDLVADFMECCGLKLAELLLTCISWFM